MMMVPVMMRVMTMPGMRLRRDEGGAKRERQRRENGTVHNSPDVELRHLSGAAGTILNGISRGVSTTGHIQCTALHL